MEWGPALDISNGRRPEGIADDECVQYLTRSGRQGRDQAVHLGWWDDSVTYHVRADHPIYQKQSPSDGNLEVGEMDNWGPEIEIDGIRPVWLGDDERIKWRANDTKFDGWYTTTAMDCNWVVFNYIRLPADHWAYHVIAAGFTPWRSDVDEAPADWDGGPVLLRNGSHGVPPSKPWRAAVYGKDIIGYKRKPEPRMSTADLIAELRTRTDLPKGVVLPEPEPDWEAWRKAALVAYGEYSDSNEDTLIKDMTRALIAARPYMPKD